jgi:hypothetical protein
MPSVGVRRTTVLDDCSVETLGVVLRVGGHEVNRICIYGAWRGTSLDQHCTLN